MADNNRRPYQTRDSAEQRSSEAAPRPRTDDPLAELARLIGQKGPINDPDNGRNHDERYNPARDLARDLAMAMRTAGQPQSAPNPPLRDDNGGYASNREARTFGELARQLTAVIQPIIAMEKRAVTKTTAATKKTRATKKTPGAKTIVTGTTTATAKTIDTPPIIVTSATTNQKTTAATRMAIMTITRTGVTMRMIMPMRTTKPMPTGTMRMARRAAASVAALFSSPQYSP